MLQSIASAIQIFQFDFQRLLHVVVACGVLHVPKKKKISKLGDLFLRRHINSLQVGRNKNATGKNFARQGGRTERRSIAVAVWLHTEHFSQFALSHGQTAW